MSNGSGVYRAECSRVYGGAVRSRRLEMAGHCIKHPLPGDPRLLCSLIEIRRNDRLSAAQAELFASDLMQCYGILT